MDETQFLRRSPFSPHHEKLLKQGTPTTSLKTARRAARRGRHVWLCEDRRDQRRAVGWFGDGARPVERGGTPPGRGSEVSGSAAAGWRRRRRALDGEGGRIGSAGPRDDGRGGKRRSARGGGRLRRPDLA